MYIKLSVPQNFLRQKSVKEEGFFVVDTQGSVRCCQLTLSKFSWPVSAVPKRFKKNYQIEETYLLNGSDSLKKI